MSVVNAVRTKMLAATAGVKVVRGIATPSQTPPIVVLGVGDDDEQRTTSGTTAAPKYLELDVECWESTATKAEALADDIKGVFRDFTGAMGSYTVLFSRFYNSFESQSGDAMQFGYSFTLRLTYK